MRAIIERNKGVYLVKIYNNDNELVDILAVEQLYFRENEESKKGGKK